MKQLNSRKELRERLKELDLQRAALELDMKRELDEAAAGFKPIKLIRNALTPGSNEDEERPGLLPSLLGTGAAFLVKKLLFRSSPAGMAAGVTASLIQGGLSALVAARPDLPQKALGWIGKLFRRRKENDTDK